MGFSPELVRHPENVFALCEELTLPARSEDVPAGKVFFLSPPPPAQLAHQVLFSRCMRALRLMFSR